MRLNKCALALASGLCIAIAAPAASAQNQYTDSLGYTHTYTSFRGGNRNGNGPVGYTVPASVKAAYRQGDMDKVASRLIRSARHGNTASMRYLALGYARGEVLEQDPTKATFWFRKAAENGDPLSMYALSRLYAVGTGEAPSQQKADFWLRRSAGHGFDQAVWALHDRK